ncbi:MAG: lysophospholipase [Alphaproteobacteria bacterium]|jgi:lysophospholipase
MPYYISHENNVNAYPQTDSMAFFQDKFTTGIWKQASGVDSFYGFVINDKASKCIVISQGRSESLVKYAEFIYELYQNGYSVFMFDHQGQGLSSRLLSNRHIGYVKNFNDYVEDLHALIEKVLNPLLVKHNQGDLHKVLLCHSLGGAIGTLYVQVYPNVFSKLVLSAPMLGILSPVSESLLQFILIIVLKLRGIFGLKDNYILGQGDYHAQAFDKNQLTNSKVRYRIFREMMANYPQNQLGGISANWLLQSIYGMRKARANASSILLPTLVLQAEQEQIVDNEKMTQFAEELPQASLVVVANARHELLFEKDEVRASIVAKILNFIALP